MTTDTTTSALDTAGPTANEGVTARATSWRRFARHYVMMVLAMYAGNMTVPVVLLMLRHRHGSAAVVEMAGSMVVPTAVAAGLLMGIIPAGLVMTIAHVGMLPAMWLVMLRRYREYA